MSDLQGYIPRVTVYVELLHVPRRTGNNTVENLSDNVHCGHPIADWGNRDQVKVGNLPQHPPEGWRDPGKSSTPEGTR